MKMALIVLGILVALIIAIVIIGAVLPKRHSATRSAMFSATSPRLFELITGPQDWRPDLRSYERGQDAAGHAWIRETSKRGDTITYEVVALEPPRRYTARIADKNLPYGGQWTYDLTPHGSQTELRITEDGEVYNPVFRFVSRFVIGHTRTIETYLQALATQTGDNIAIRP
jgi:hypothetical protein